MRKRRHLIILPCSKEKRQLDNVKAINLYNGPFYKIIRKFNLDNIDLLIMSAKYGLIDSNHLISYYDMKMTTERAKEIAEETQLRLNDVLVNSNYEEILINLGKTYMVALEYSRSLLEAHNTCWIDGRIGERIHKLKNWLNLNIKQEGVQEP